MTGLAIAGFGTALSDLGAAASRRVLLRDAVEAAIADAGVERGAIDGYISTMGPVDDLRFLGLSPSFASSVDSGGASPAAALVIAMGAIGAGLAKTVLCTFASVRAPGSTAGDMSHAYPSLWGFTGALTSHALLAERYLETHGGSGVDLAAVAVAQREHGRHRDDSMYTGKVLTVEQHQASRLVADPLRLLDCCRDANVGVAVVVTSEQRATGLGDHTVWVRGIGSGENVRNWHAGAGLDFHDDLEGARDAALRQAGIVLADLDLAQLYDPFTISVLMQLEQYGFCGPGEAADFVRSGATSITGAVPTNTDGGQLSGCYAIGFTPLVEAVRQLRGLGGPTQVAGARWALVSNHGGSAGAPGTWHHLTLVLEGGASA